jgi:transposase
MKLVKTTSHLLLNINNGKNTLLKEFIAEYDKATRYFIDYLWNNKITFSYEKKIKDSELTETLIKVLDIKNDQLECPSFISTVGIEPKTNLSARALKASSTQACSIVSAELEKRKRKLFVISDLSKKGKRTRGISKRLKEETIFKPNPAKILPEISSLLSKVEKSSIKHYDSILTLSSLGKYYGKIIIPFNQHKHSRNLQKRNYKLKSGIQLSTNKIYFRWEVDVAEKENGILVGADTGINSIVTLSDKQKSQPCNHGHTLNSILKKITSKEKGSKAFHKALAHRDNYICWSINQLNLSNIKEVRLEKITNFRHKKNVSKFLNYMNETLIRSKLIDTLQEHGVHLKEESSAYRSQRCSSCGYVDSKNRKNTDFSCKHCSFSADADYNASCNHEITLPSASFLLSYLDKPKKFFWKEEGFFNLDNSELTVSGLKRKFR